MQLKSLCVATGVAMLSIVPSLSVAKTNPEGWNGEIDLSYILQRGNTISNSLAGKINAEYDGPVWRHTAKLEATNTQSQDPVTGDLQRTAERYFASYKLDHKFNETNYIFNIVTYEKDRFSGYLFQASYALGYGRRVLNTDTQTMDLEAGPGYRVRCAEPADSYTNCPNQTGKPIARLAVKYKYKISDHATFKEEASTEADTDAASSRAETSITSKINDHLSLRLSHLLTYNSTVPDGNKKMDQQMTVSLVYGF